MGFFSVNKEVFPIGISLCGPIRGTKSDGKLNLLIYTLLINIKIIIFEILYKALYKALYIKALYKALREILYTKTLRIETLY